MHPCIDQSILYISIDLSMHITSLLIHFISTYLSINIHISTEFNDWYMWINHSTYHDDDTKATSSCSQVTRAFRGRADQ